ncbi:MAG: helix-turn-helix domain-containing protein [Deltaproteobacteria bacterium]|nr:helix-turn-helix domain-containing protein [Deltaproteobacteria bacterium]
MSTEIGEYRLLRPEEVAKILRLSKPRIYQLAKSGLLPFFRFGKSVRFLESDVFDFIRSRRIAAAVV